MSVKNKEIKLNVPRNSILIKIFAYRNALLIVNLKEEVILVWQKISRLHLD